MKGVAAMIGALALALVAGACASPGGVRTVKGDWYGYSPHYLQYAASRGSLPTIVAGSAVPNVAKPDFDRRVLDEMSGRPLGVGPLKFELMGSGGAKPPLFVSLVFNPELSYGGYEACDPALAGAAGRPAQRDGSTRVVAAFCSSQRLLTSTVGEADGLTGADDPRLVQLIRLVMVDLFPLRDPNVERSCTSCP